MKAMGETTDIAHCSEYNTTGNICEECNIGYYLEDNACILQFVSFTYPLQEYLPGNEAHRLQNRASHYPFMGYPSGGIDATFFGIYKYIIYIYIYNMNRSP